MKQTLMIDLLSLPINVNRTQWVQNLKRSPMLWVNQKIENNIINLAASSGQTVDEFLKMLLDIYQDQQDIQEAERVRKEPGGISLPDVREKSGLWRYSETECRAWFCCATDKHAAGSSGGIGTLGWSAGPRGSKQFHRLIMSDQSRQVSVRICN